MIKSEYSFLFMGTAKSESIIYDLDDSLTLIIDTVCWTIYCVIKSILVIHFSIGNISQLETCITDHFFSCLFLISGFLRAGVLSHIGMSLLNLIAFNKSMCWSMYKIHHFISSYALERFLILEPSIVTNIHYTNNFHHP